MKLMTLAACAVFSVIVMALIVHFTPGEIAAEPQNTTIVNEPAPASQRAARHTPIVEQPGPQESQNVQAAVSFAGAQYVHRFSDGNEYVLMHEFTPRGQSDLQAWTEMLTVTNYRQVNDVDGLATIAEMMLSMYESAGGTIIGTTSFATEDGTQVELLLVGMLYDRTIVEAVFNRFVLHEGAGYNVMFSHRMYGEGVSEAMSDWLQKNGPNTAERLMSLDAAGVIAAASRK